MFVRSLASGSTPDSPTARQIGLFSLGAPGIPDGTAPMERTDLGCGAWIERCPQWLPGADAWFDALAQDLPWEQARRTMYDRIVDVPRLIWTGSSVDSTPPQVLDRIDQLAEVLAARYGRPFDRRHANWYRSGADSVAWHCDSVPDRADSIVAIVSVGADRPLGIRPLDKTDSARMFSLGWGDLFVMGGTMQATWEHAVPKVARAEPRISLLLRG